MSNPTDPESLTRVFEVKTEDLTNHPDAWTSEEIAAMERASLESWNNIDDPHRRAMAVIMRDCLIRLLENPVEWLPTSLSPESSTRIGVYLFINLDEVETQVVEMRMAAELELHNQIQGIAELRDSLAEPQENR